MVACSAPKESTPASKPASTPASVAPSSAPASQAPASTPAPVDNLKTWPSAEIKAGLASEQTEVDFGNDVKGYKTDGLKLTLAYNSAEAKKVMFKLLLSVKVKNASLAGFWKSGSKEKTSITVNDVKLDAPEEDFKLDSKGLTEQHATAIDGTSALAVPAWADIIEIDLKAGDNTIVLENHSGDYRFFICGAAIA